MCFLTTWFPACREQLCRIVASTWWEELRSSWAANVLSWRHSFSDHVFDCVSVASVAWEGKLKGLFVCSVRSLDCHRLLKGLYCPNIHRLRPLFQCEDEQAFSTFGSQSYLAEIPLPAPTPVLSKTHTFIKILTQKVFRHKTLAQIQKHMFPCSVSSALSFPLWPEGVLSVFHPCGSVLLLWCGPSCSLMVCRRRHTGGWSEALPIWWAGWGGPGGPRATLLSTPPSTGSSSAL